MSQIISSVYIQWLSHRHALTDPGHIWQINVQFKINLPSLLLLTSRYIKYVRFMNTWFGCFHSENENDTYVIDVILITHFTSRILLLKSFYYNHALISNYSWE